MKSYKNFLLEKVNLENFDDDYDKLISDIYEYWDILNDRIKELSEFNIDRDSKEVAEYNQKIKSIAGKSTVNKPINIGSVGGSVGGSAGGSAGGSVSVGLTPREIDFISDSTEQLKRKLNNPKYKDYKNTISDLIKRREEKDKVMLN